MSLAEVHSGHCSVELNVLSLPDKSLQSAHVLSGEAIPETLLPDPQNKSAAGFSCNIQPNIPWPLIGDSVAHTKMYCLLLTSILGVWAGAWNNKYKYKAHEKDIPCVHMVICPDAPKWTKLQLNIIVWTLLSSLSRRLFEKRTSHITPRGQRFKCPPTPNHHPGLCPLLHPDHPNGAFIPKAPILSP